MYWLQIVLILALAQIPPSLRYTPGNALVLNSKCFSLKPVIGHLTTRWLFSILLFSQKTAFAFLFPDSPCTVRLSFSEYRIRYSAATHQQLHHKQRCLCARAPPFNNILTTRATRIIRFPLPIVGEGWGEGTRDLDLLPPL